MRRVLCPVDFSEPSRRALRHALAIARWHEASLTVLHVEDLLLGTARAEVRFRAHFAVSLHDELRTFVDEAGGDAQSVKAVAASGDAVGGILEQARKEASDLIVMGTRGRSRLARAVMGSVTERVVRHSLCPVMTIPSGAHAPFADELAPFDPILCASDFSPACRKALDLAIAMGQEADARVVLLHALRVPQIHNRLRPMPVPMHAGIDFARRRRDAFVRLKRGLPMDAVFRCRPESLVADGHPADAILRTVHNENVKLIVMGVQTRGTLDRLLFGSTTRRVIQAAVCPVLSVRADESAEPWVAVPSLTHQPVGAGTSA